MTNINWIEIRQVAVYPTMFIFGIAWSVLYFLRWRGCVGRCPGNVGSALLGGAVALWAGCGFVAIWIAEATGFTKVTGSMFTLGAVGVVVVLIVGVVKMALRIWHQENREKWK